MVWKRCGSKPSLIGWLDPVRSDLLHLVLFVGGMSLVEIELSVSYE